MRPNPDSPLRMVIALGGNAILRAGERGTIEQQFVHARQTMRAIARLAGDGHQIVITHGNGPVVGNIVLRGEAARATVPPMPLYIAGADSEGGVGLMLQQALHNEMLAIGVHRPIATLVTQTVVDLSDPAFANPTKPIGPYLTQAEAAARTDREGWTVVEYPGRGWRRVVASPLPERIVEMETVTHLAAEDVLVIAAGGGGVPVSEAADGSLQGVDAVVDKDWSGALLACAMNADIYAILMETDAVYVDWGLPTQHALAELTTAEARGMLESGSLEPGTVAPKIAAAAYAADTCGCVSLITGSESLAEAIAGRAGTRIEAGGEPD